MTMSLLSRYCRGDCMPDPAGNLRVHPFPVCCGTITLLKHLQTFVSSTGLPRASDFSGVKSFAAKRAEMLKQVCFNAATAHVFCVVQSHIRNLAMQVSVHYCRWASQTTGRSKVQRQTRSASCWRKFRPLEAKPVVNPAHLHGIIVWLMLSWLSATRILSSLWWASLYLSDALLHNPWLSGGLSHRNLSAGNV